MMKKVIFTAFIVCVITILVVFYSKSSQWQVAGRIVNQFDHDDKVLALTFDDGPWETTQTEAVLDILDSLDIVGTFFLNGSGIQHHINVAKKIVNAGHEVGNHAYEHERLIFKSSQYIAESLSKTQQLIRKIGFEGEIYFRPPYGQKLWNLPHYLNTENITTVMWSVKPEYPHTDSAEVIAARMIHQVKSGDIVLLHVLNKNSQPTIQALPIAVPTLRQQGYRFVTVSELLRKDVKYKDRDEKRVGKLNPTR